MIGSKINMLFPRKTSIYSNAHHVDNVMQGDSKGDHKRLRGILGWSDRRVVAVQQVPGQPVFVLVTET